MDDEIKELMNSITSDFEISITTGYSGFLASDLIYSAPNYVSAINETVAMDFAHVFSYLGKRSLVVMKNAGLNESLLPIINSCILGVNAGLVLWVVDDLKVAGSEILQNSYELIKLLGIKPMIPKTYEELYSMTRESYINSEKNKIPQLILLTNKLLGSKISYERKKHPNNCLASKEKCVLHPKTARKFMTNFNKHKQIATPMFPLLIKQEFTHKRLISTKYESLFSLVRKLNFDVAIGDFGTYTLAEGSIINYGLHYGGAVACGVGAVLANKKPIVFVGEGGFTSGFEAILEVLRKNIKLKIILIENGGISEKEEVNIDLIKLCNQIGINSVRIKESEIDKITQLLKREDVILIAVDYSK